jgi:hypothetical protein
MTEIGAIEASQSRNNKRSKSIVENIVSHILPQETQYEHRLGQKC